VLAALAYGPLSATSAIVRGAVADGAAAVGVVLDNSVTLANALARVVSVKNNGSEIAWVDPSGGVGASSTYASTAAPFTVRGWQANVNGAIGVILDAGAALVGVGAKLVSIRSGGVEVAYVDKEGKIGGGSKGQQVSASTGAFNTNSAAYTDVTNATVTITSTGRPVMLFLRPDGAAAAYLGVPATATAGLVLLRDATVIGEWSYVNPDASDTERYEITALSADAVAAGTYVYKLQIKTSTGSVNLPNAQLFAFEL
jgi:hypothetical protein